VRVRLRFDVGGGRAIGGAGRGDVVRRWLPAVDLETPVLADEPRPTEALATSGGPETLLHGDLGTPNAIVSHAAGGLDARLDSAWEPRATICRCETIQDLYGDASRSRGSGVPSGPGQPAVRDRRAVPLPTVIIWTARLSCTSSPPSIAANCGRQVSRRQPAKK
jgi:hypothetical protein